MNCIYLPGDSQRFANYHRAVNRAGAAVSTNAPEDCCALLLPGGGDIEPWRYGQENTASRDLEAERDHAELELIHRFLSAGKPILGVCRGMQLLNVYFGGTLAQDISGHSQVDGAARLHSVRTAPSLFQSLTGETTLLNSAHHQAVDRPGPGLLPVQWSDDGIIEGMLHRTLPIWAVQWHPERLGETGLAFLRAFLSLCSEFPTHASSRKNLF